ncbi:MAG: TraR/DksA C4-type zinc finger protein [Acidiferrobacterales bacterium]
MPDLIDDASELEEIARVSALHRARTRLQTSEIPDEDDAGNRFCLDCGEAIPRARVNLVGAVRCVDCAKDLERAARGFATRVAGGRSS